MGLYPDEEVQKYVTDLGMAMATVSERPTLPWKFYVLDDPIVNAFALPGGSIFITRGILTHMNSEAELVSVLGHEIGHVTAKHSVNQMSKQQMAQLGIGLGTALLPEIIAPWSDLASAGLGFLFLKFGRDDERQSDQLGFGYMVKQGYDPREMAAMFRTLDRQGKLQRAGELPEWESTHPAPENRVVATQNRVREMSVDPDSLKVARDPFLGHLDGMRFGEDPRLGYFKGTVFYHPDLAFTFAFPDGWKTVNQADSVVGISPEQDAVVQLKLEGRKAPDEHAEEFFKQAGIEAGRHTREPIRGMNAYRGYFKANTQSGILAGLVSWIAYGDNTYRITSFTSDQKLQSYQDQFLAVPNSFDEVTDKAVLNVTSAKISLVRADRDMTLREFDERFPSTIPIERLALINGLETNGQIRKGQTVKRVQDGEQP